MRKKILVWAYAVKNLGDDLFLKVLFDRYKDVDWYILHAKSEYKEIFKLYDNVHTLPYTRSYMYKFTKNLINFNKYDAMVYIGGSIYMQLPVWESQYDDRLFIANKFKKLGKKVFVIGANFGPYNDNLFESKYRELFKSYDDVCFRDSYSFDKFNDLDNIRIAPDVVFQLDKNKINESNTAHKKNVGFSIINLDSRENLKKYTEIYNTKIKELIELYIKSGYGVSMFSFCKEEGDELAINNIINKLDNNYKSNIEVINYTGNLDEFLSKFKSMDTIIGTRFHSVILSQVFGQDVYPLIYSDKTYNTLKDLGIEKTCSYISDLNNIDAKEIKDSAKNNKIKDIKIFEESVKQFEALDKFI